MSEPAAILPATTSRPCILATLLSYSTLCLSALACAVLHYGISAGDRPHFSARIGLLIRGDDAATKSAADVMVAGTRQRVPRADQVRRVVGQARIATSHRGAPAARAVAGRNLRQPQRLGRPE